MAQNGPPKIIDIYCTECGKYLLGAPPKSLTFCPTCKVWNEIINIQGVDDSGNST